MKVNIHDHIERLEDLPDWYKGTNQEYKQYLFECPVCGWNTNSIYHPNYAHFEEMIVNHVRDNHPHIDLIYGVTP
jgi:DNA-binding ferritin-like protein (Dps family)